MASKSARRLLIVEVVEARNVIACEKSGTSDPFIQLSLFDIAGREIKNEKYETTVKKKTLNPSWKQQFTFGNKSPFAFF